MGKKLIFLVFAVFLLSVSFISAQPTFDANFDFAEGYTISSSGETYLSQGQSYQINFFVYNKSDGSSIDNSQTNCTFYMTNKTGDVIISNNSNYANSYWSYVIDGGNFSALGEYDYGIYCSNYLNTVGGAYVNYFDVTYNGKQLSISQSFLYFCLFIVLFFVFGMNIYFISKLPNRNQQDEDGRILSVTYLKYFRDVLWFTEWMIFIAIIYLSSNLAFAYLNEQMFAQILFTMFKICFGLTPLIVTVWVVWIFVSMFHDREFQQMLNRGIFPQGKL